MNRSLPPYPVGAPDLKLTPVLTLADEPDISVDAWNLAASNVVLGGQGDPDLAPDTLALPVMQDGALFKVALGDLMRPDAHGGDVADTLRATIAAAAAHALAMRRLIHAAERLLHSPAVTPTGVAR